MVVGKLLLNTDRFYPRSILLSFRKKNYLVIFATMTTDYENGSRRKQ